MSHFLINLLKSGYHAYICAVAKENKVFPLHRNHYKLLHEEKEKEKLVVSFLKKKKTVKEEKLTYFVHFLRVINSTHFIQI